MSTPATGRPSEPAYIRFMAPVDEVATASLLATCDGLVARGVSTITLLISTPGGSVFHGISAYNYIRSLPVELITYNFGSVDSIGVVLFCAGKLRKSVPNARFMIHGVQANIAGPAVLSEDQIQESLKSVQIDTQNIARIIAEHTKKSEADIHAAMRAKTTLDPKQAAEFGLVDQIEVLELPPRAQVHTIQAQPKGGVSMLPGLLQAQLGRPMVAAVP
jgi:ATP-dependent Clp protease, protease subunit